MISVVSDLRAYFYDVFVAKLDFWLVFGLVAQLLFTARFLVQWLVSEKLGKSVVPVAFWFLSMGGGIMLLIYGLVRREPIIILGQGRRIAYCFTESASASDETSRPVTRTRTTAISL